MNIIDMQVSVTAENCYKILGLSDAASSEEIKKAYRELAKKYHPDRNSSHDAGETFKKLTEAYQVALKVAELRSVSCKTPEHPVKRSPDLILRMPVSLDDVVLCAHKTIIFKRKNLCNACKATGSKIQKIKTCLYCGGTGLRGLDLIFGQKRRCLYCEGLGRIPERPLCNFCNGRGIVYENVKKEIVLNPIAEDIIFLGEGNHYVNSSPGNLIIQFDVIKHPFYSQSGLDLTCSIDISPAQAVLGDKIKLFVFGEDVEITIPAGIQNSKKIIIPNHGIHYKGKTGNLVVTVTVRIPRIITEAEEELYRQIIRLEKETTWPKILKL